MAKLYRVVLQAAASADQPLSEYYVAYVEVQPGESANHSEATMAVLNATRLDRLNRAAFAGRIWRVREVQSLPANLPEPDWNDSEKGIRVWVVRRPET